MEIKILKVGELQTNCYIVTKNNKSIIIDPGAEADEIMSECSNLEVVALFCTHPHYDHIDALEELEKHYDLIGNDFSEIYFDMEIIKTPGHHEDSLTFYFPDDKIMFTGDFLFKETIGRMDLPTGNVNDMKSSLEMISKYPDDIKIYPGHGESSLLGTEKKYFNEYKSYF